MDISQRGKVQKTHNAGLILTIVLELLALVILSVLVCFFRQVIRSVISVGE